MSLQLMANNLSTIFPSKFAIVSLYFLMITFCFTTVQTYYFPEKIKFVILAMFFDFVPIFIYIVPPDFFENESSLISHNNVLTVSSSYASSNKSCLFVQSRCCSIIHVSTQHTSCTTV